MAHTGASARRAAAVRAASPERRAVTLHDVAQEAGVAISTVSRALTDPDRVSVRTREHVQAVAHRLGYRPNRIAQALPSGRTWMLALLVTDITNPHNFVLIRGAEAQARAAGYTLVLGDTQGSAELESDHTDRLGSVVDGVVLASSRLPAGRIPSWPGAVGRAVQPRGGRVPERRDGSASTAAGRSWSTSSHWDIARSPTCRAPGAVVRQRTLAGTGLPRRGGRRRHRPTRPVLPTLDQRPAAAEVGLASGATALVAFNDLFAIGVLQRLERRGVNVPVRSASSATTTSSVLISAGRR